MLISSTCALTDFLADSSMPSFSMEEEDRNLEEKFDAAVKVIWSLPEEGDKLPLLLLLVSEGGLILTITQA